MKTTIDIDTELLVEAKSRAAARGLSLKAFIEEALRARMLPRPEKRSRYRMRFPVVEDAAPAAADPADRDRLYDLMEGRS
jgi:hypothetical protein